MFRYAVVLFLFLTGCYEDADQNNVKANDVKSVQEEENDQSIKFAKTDKDFKLPEPNLDHSARKFSQVVGWENNTPVAPKDFKVTLFAKGLNNPRRVFQLPNGHVLVAEASTEPKSLKEKLKNRITGKSLSQNIGNSANRVTILIDENNDGVAESSNVLVEGIRQPYGIAYSKGHLYVAGTDSVLKFPYKLGDKKIDRSTGKVILNLPAGGYNNHWTRNLLLSKDEKHLFVSVGSASNIAEHGMAEEKRRANILRVDLDGKNEVIYGAGLRNPVGMDLSQTGKLWTVVNERDMLGDDLVPDYLTEVSEGDFYGWPYAYYGANKDPRVKDQKPELVKKTLIPDVALGSHTASLGLAFYDKEKFPKKYHGGAFIGQHGSWNRSEIVGYQVAFVPFKNGKPSGKPEVFLEGFIKDKNQALVYGRPVSVEVLNNGDILVSDDASDSIWHVTYKSK